MKTAFIELEMRDLGTGSRLRVFTATSGDDRLNVFVAQERGRWHLSISVFGQKRYPTYDEIADARYQLLPNDVDVAMILPPIEDYVNVGHVFHLWQITDGNVDPLARGIGCQRTYLDGSPAT